MAKSRVFLVHGVATGVRSGLSIYRSMLGEDKFIHHLRAKKKKYVSLRAALAGKGDALTIDDGTASGARAAKLARHHGHEVSLFINPELIETCRPYFFSILNAMLDAAKDQVEFDGTEYRLSCWKERERFRRTIRNELARCSTESEREKMLDSLGNLLGCSCVEVPSFYATLSLEEIRELNDLGVSIENHGWSHGDMFGRTDKEIKREIRLAREWITDQLGKPPTSFAVPFGRVTPERGWSEEAQGPWLLADRYLFEGWMGSSVFNRVSLQPK